MNEITHSTFVKSLWRTTDSVNIILVISFRLKKLLSHMCVCMQNLSSVLVYISLPFIFILPMSMQLTHHTIFEDHADTNILDQNERHN